MKLIDKAAVVARIEEGIKEYSKSKKEYPTCEEYYEGALDVLEDFKDKFLNTLEVKEVNLEKEFYDFLDTLIGKDNGHLSEDELFHIAEHFFELGLNVGKGE